MDRPTTNKVDPKVASYNILGEQLCYCSLTKPGNLLIDIYIDYDNTNHAFVPHKGFVVVHMEKNIRAFSHELWKRQNFFCSQSSL